MDGRSSSSAADQNCPSRISRGSKAGCASRRSRRLLTLARVYGIPLADLLGDSEPKSARCTITRAGGTRRAPGNSLKYRPVSGGAELTDLQAFEVALPPGRDINKFNHHEGEEWLYVLEGRLGLVFGDEEHWLESGDSVHFDARTGHRLVTAKSGGAAAAGSLGCGASKSAPPADLT